MIQNLITACLLTVSIGNTAIIKNDTKNNEPYNRIETYIEENLYWQTQTEWNYNESLQTDEDYHIYWTNSYLNGQLTNNLTGCQVKARNVKQITYTNDRSDNPSTWQKNLYNIYAIEITPTTEDNKIRIEYLYSIGNLVAALSQYTENTYVYWQWSDSLSSAVRSDYESFLNGTTRNFLPYADLGNFNDEQRNEGTNLTLSEQKEIDDTSICFYIEQNYYTGWSTEEPNIYRSNEIDELPNLLKFQYSILIDVINPDRYEVIDVAGLLFSILTMPFAFFSQAFNLTIFPGTPYQVNISNLILSIIAALIFIFIIKKVLK